MALGFEGFEKILLSRMRIPKFEDTEIRSEDTDALFQDAEIRVSSAG